MNSDIRQQSMWEKLIARAQAILMTPKTEWPIIAEEQTTPADLYKNYILILSAIPAVCMFLKSSVIGTTIPILGTMRVGIVSGLRDAIVNYVLGLVAIYVVALIVDALAPTFGATKNQNQALKTVTYAYTAAWVAGVGWLIPIIGTLILLVGGLYSFYLLYTGLPFTMKAPPEKALPYTAVVIVCAVVLTIVVSTVTGSLLGIGALSIPGAVSQGSNATFDPSSPLGQLEGWANRLEQANKSYESAQASGDSAAAQQALSGLLGTALGSGGDTSSLPPEELRVFVPERLAGLARSDISVEKNALLGIQMSEAKATYSDGAAKRIELEINDLGGTRGLMALAAWANVEQDKQTATGYEKTYKGNGRVMHEVWDQQNKTGEYSVIVANRFMVKVTGGGPNIDTLKGAANAINLAGLEAASQKTAPR